MIEVEAFVPSKDRIGLASQAWLLNLSLARSIEKAFVRTTGEVLQNLQSLYDPNSLYLEQSQHQIFISSQKFGLTLLLIEHSLPLQDA